MNTTDSSTSWSPTWRWFVSVLLLVHLFSVVIAPLADPPPSSEFSRAMARAVSPYLQAAALDNGYRFFAPDPGPSHLVRYELAWSDGRLTTHHFPSREDHFPRLLYHRHFMLAEMISSLAGPFAEEPPDGFINQRERSAFHEQKQRAMILVESVASYLLRSHPEVDEIRLFLVTHVVPTPADVRNGMKLDDARLYSELPLGRFTRSYFQL